MDFAQEMFDFYVETNKLLRDMVQDKETKIKFFECFRKLFSSGLDRFFYEVFYEEGNPIDGICVDATPKEVESVIDYLDFNFNKINACYEKYDSCGCEILFSHNIYYLEKPLTIDALENLLAYLDSSSNKNIACYEKYKSADLLGLFYSVFSGDNSMNLNKFDSIISYLDFNFNKISNCYKKYKSAELDSFFCNYVFFGDVITVDDIENAFNSFNSLFNTTSFWYEKFTSNPKIKKVQ